MKSLFHGEFRSRTSSRRAAVFLTLAMAMTPGLAFAEDGEPAVSEATDGEFTYMLAVDGFYMADFNNPDSPDATSGVAHRAFDYTNGFGLAFAAVDVAYEDSVKGATLQLRFGEGANRLIGSANPVLASLKQAFVTWKPTEALVIDFGQFDTIYGAEVSESWANLNYTRGALYYLMQPFYHQGLRAGYTLNDTMGLTFLVVNGTNNVIDNNQTPHLGIQFSMAATEAVSFVIGYYTGAGSSGFGPGAPTSDDDWENFFDLVVNAAFGDLTLVFNADAYISGSESDNQFYWGASLAAGHPLSEDLSIAGRIEFLQDSDQYLGAGYEDLLTGTVTLDYQPFPGIIIRLDGRVESASDPVFPSSDGGVEDTWVSTILGFVVHT